MNEEIELLKEKIEQFKNNIQDYKSKLYDEYNTRADFIDVFFAALGWDMYNTQGIIEQFREVVREDKVIIQGKKKAPDYAFKIGPQVVFYVEAKKPSVDIKNDPEPAYQLRRYAHTQGLSLSILTDFEEIAVYDTRVKPEVNDRASVARVFYCTYDHLFDRFMNETFDTNFDFLLNTFSKNAILNGSFNRYAEENKNKKGTSSVDKGFLSLLDSWRSQLASNIALKNEEIDEYNLNIAVQKIIDRFVFLRIAEDRLIEESNLLLNITSEDELYQKLNQIFERANTKYNSGLFDSEDWFKNLVIEDTVISEIIHEMYYPKCSYEFSVLPIEILGNAYEQFLGKTIKFTRKTKFGHKIEIEEKPEVRKAGGVYYTPDYIVDFIVQNTLAEKIQTLSPDQISEIKILDPACGSGSFLIAAYDFLIRFHLQYYLKSETQKKKAIKEGIIYQVTEERYKLSTAKKSEILINNIHGVDIDTQAVEVTKLSLLLKVLEDENLEYAEELFKAQQQHLLPDLSNNIKCGNSLIESDFYRDKDLSLFGMTEMRKINTFDWKNEFSKILTKGGFDIIIGNPPYLRIQGLQENYGDQIDYLKNKYESAVKRFDLYLLFLEKGFSLLKDSGKLGFINPHKFLNSDFGSGLRQYLIDNKAVEKVISFNNNLVFDQASTYTGLFFLSKPKSSSFAYFEINDLKGGSIQQELINLKTNMFASISYSQLTNDSWTLTDSNTKDILKKLDQIKYKAKDIFSDIMVGIQSGIDDIHILEIQKEKPNTLICHSQETGGLIEIEKDICKKLLMGDDVKRYSLCTISKVEIYPYSMKNGKTKIIEENELKTNYPLCYNYLLQYKSKLLEKRISQKTNPLYWYSLHRPRKIEKFETKKILTPEISLGCNMTIDENHLYHNTQVYSILAKEDFKESNLYWLAILNSNLFWWFLTQTGTVLRGGYFRFKTKYIEPFPIVSIDFQNSELVKSHDKIVSLVKKRLELGAMADSSQGNQDTHLIQNMINPIEKQINREVYKLYGLDDIEIQEIEKSKV